MRPWKMFDFRWIFRYFRARRKNRPRRSTANYFFLEGLEDRTLLSVLTWTGASQVSNNWSDPQNWSPSVAPGSGDTANFTATSPNARVNAIVDLNDTVTLIVDSTYGGQISVNNGVTLTLSGTSNWQSGSIVANGSGSLVNTGNLNAAGANLTFSGTLSNSGSINTAGANLTFSGMLSNTGSINTAGANVNFSGTQSNTGSINVQTGTLTLSGGGTNSGAFTEAANATMDISSGTYTFQAGASSSGAGILDVAGGTLTAAANVAVQNLTLANGTVTGAGTWTASGMLLWTGGTMLGVQDTNGNWTGTTDAKGELTLGGTAANTSYSEILNGRTLNNYGTATLSSFFNTQGLTLYNNALLDNKPGASFKIATDAQIGGGAGPAPGVTVLNEGTLAKTGGTGTSALTSSSGNVNFKQIGSGQIQVLSGTLSLQCIADINDVAGTNGVSVANGTTLAIDSQTTTLHDGTKLTGAGTITVRNGTVGIPGGTVIDSAPLNFSGGTITGAGDLTVTGMLTWTGGSMLGVTDANGNWLGTTDAKGGLTLGDTAASTSYNETLNGRTLNNYGTATLSSFFSGQGLILYNSALLDNKPCASFKIATDAGISGGAGAASGVTMLNEGTFAKTGGTGTSPLTSSLGNLYFKQIGSGQIQVLSGTLSLQCIADINDVAGTNGVSVANGTTLAFDSQTATLHDGTQLTGTGTVAVRGDTVVIPAGTVTASAPLTLSSGTIQGAGKLIVAGVMNWTGGTVGLAGVTGRVQIEVVADGALAISGANIKPITNAEIDVDDAADATWSGTGGISANSGAVWNNLVGSTFDAQSDTTYSGSGAGIAFNNAGTFTKSAGATKTATTFSGVAFVNTGTVEIQAGTLSFSGDYTQNGGETALDGNTLTVGNTSNVNIAGGGLTGPGTINGNVVNAGEISPAELPAGPLFKINGKYTQTASGTLNVDIGGTVPTTEFDQISITGAATLGGTLNINLADDYLPTDVDTFAVMSFASRSGKFATIDGLEISPVEYFTPVYNPLDPTKPGNLTLNVDLKLAANVTASASSNPSVYGQSVTLTATVAADVPADGTPTGSVTFYDGETDLGTVDLNANGQASLSPAILAAGSHTITIDYDGDDFFLDGSSDPFLLTVNPAGTTTAIKSDTNTSVYGQPVKFTTTVSANAPGEGTPTGTVQFVIDGANYGDPVTLSGGTASVSVAALNVVGSPHTVAAVYTNSDGDFSNSDRELSGGQTVEQAETTTLLTVDNHPTLLGQVVTYTAQVAAVAPGAGAPTGTVQFFDGLQQLDEEPLVNGQASFKTSSLPVGDHSIRADYSGDDNFLDSQSQALVDTVKQPTTAYVDAAYAGDETGEQVTWIDGSVHFFGADAFDAIQPAVDAVANGGTVDVAAGTYKETVTISEDLTLTGTGQNGDDPILDGIGQAADAAGIAVAAGNVSISSLTIQYFSGPGIDLESGSSATLTTDTIIFNSPGVAVEGGAVATVTDSTISNNETLLDGAGIENNGTITITGCTISDNTSHRFGGGIDNSAVATVADCTISDNSALSDGGGIENFGTLTMTGTVVGDNSAKGDGGGVENIRTATLTDCALSDNIAAAGGDVENDGGTLTLNAGNTITGDGAVEIRGGTMVIPAGPSVTISAPLNLSGGTITGAGLLTVGGPLNWTAGTISMLPANTKSGILLVDGPMTISGTSAKFFTNGEIDTAGGVVWTDNGVISSVYGTLWDNLFGSTFDEQGDGTFLCTSSLAVTDFVNDGQFIKSAGAAGSATTFDGVSFVNSRSVDIEAGTLSVVGTYTQTTGITALNGKILKATVAIAGGTLAGPGTIYGDVTNNGVIYASGASPGDLIINGNYTQTTSGILNIGIGQYQRVQTDQLFVSEQANLDGTVDVNLVNGFIPTVPSTFQIVFFGAAVGKFATINGLSSGTGALLVPEYTAPINNDRGYLKLSAFYTPAQIRTAYGINSLAADGSGQTIAIVVAYHDPNLVVDVDAFDQQFGATANGPTLYARYGAASSFLAVVNQNGTAGLLPSVDPKGGGTGNWEAEEVMDVEWAHAIAPGARIIVVECNSATGFISSDLYTGAASAANLAGVSVVSMSWGRSEDVTETLLDRNFATPVGNSGVTFVGASGDKGSPGIYPASSPSVLAVGGTALYLNADNSYDQEIAWTGSGGGISAYESEPSYQRLVQTTGSRTIPDVAFEAESDTSVAVFDSYNSLGNGPTSWTEGYHTSLAVPCWAGLIALANQMRATAKKPPLDGFTQTLPGLYALPASDFHDITSGASTGTPTYQATPGYDLATGLGSPVANLLVPDLANLVTTTTTNLTSDPPVSVYGQQITLSATLSATFAGAGATTPTGTVDFVDSLTNTDLGASQLVDGTARLTTAALSAGPHVIIANYLGNGTDLFSSSILAMTVTPAPLTITADNLVKTYGQTLNFDGTEFTVNGLIPGDAVTGVTLTSPGALSIASVAGSPYLITPSAANGTGLGNYIINYVAGSLTVNPAPLTITANIASKTYGQVLDFAGSEFATSTLFNGDLVTGVALNSPGATSTATVDGSPYAITPTAAVGRGLDNYTITYANGILSVTPAALTVMGVTARNKVYDGSTSASIDTTVAALNGVIGTDVVTLDATGATGAFASANVGTGFTVTIAGLALGGAQADNYSLSQTVTAANITPAALSVTGITADNKVYDGSTTAAIDASAAALVGVIGDDVVTLDATAATGAFASPNVGTGIVVTIAGLALGGAQAEDYSLYQPVTTANITPAVLTVRRVTASNKIYDGSTTAKIDTTAAALVGVIGTDVVTLVASAATGEFDSADVDTGIIVTIAGLKIGGAQAGNYSLSQPVTTADITPAALTVTGITANDKIYDGTTVAALDISAAALVGVIGDDDVTLDASGVAATFATPNVGAGITVTIAGLILEGADASDYLLTQPVASASITPALLTITADNKSKTYLSANPPLTASYSGFVNGETAANLTNPPSLTTTASTSSPVGTYPIVVTGAVDPNYSIRYVNGTLTVFDGYSPQQIRQAYAFNQIAFANAQPVVMPGDGRGQTIAIVDAYDDPTIFNDLTTFDQRFGLPDPPSFIKLGQDGSTNLPAPDPTGGWEGEVALDVEWAHAIAPAAKIILIETNFDPSNLNQSFQNLFAGVATAASQKGVSVVSMSWGYPESFFGPSAEFGYDQSVFASHPGVTFVAASGDAGSPGIYPAASPYVVAVGGTSLFLNADNSYLSGQGWSGSGGGVSPFEHEPSYQTGVQSTGFRTIPDVSYNADPNTGFDVYNSQVAGGWSVVGGTSAGAPQWAALVAIVDQGLAVGGKSALDGPTQTLPALYGLPSSDFDDVTTGSNGGNSAGPGYDLVTGLGSPIANRVVADLVNSATLAVNTSTVNAVEGNAFQGPVATFTVADPAGVMGSFSSSIDWGDGHISSGMITFNANTDTFVVSGANTYAEAGTFVISVKVHGAVGSPIVGLGQALVADAPLTDTTPANNTIVLPDVGNRSTGSVVLATFTDGNPGATASDFVISVNWTGTVPGSTSESVQFISASATTSSWEVVGSASYAAPGAYPVSVRVTDEDSAGNTFNDTNTTIDVLFSTPSLGSISPSRVAIGYSSPLVLTINGSSFDPQSVVAWNGTALATTYVSATQLTATIPASDFATAGNDLITATNPAPGGGVSNSLTFRVVIPPTTDYVNAVWAGDPQGTAVAWTDGSLHVIGDDAFATIQSGIDAVANGGTVDVAAGTYCEVVAIAKSLTLLGTGSGASGTVLDGTDLNTLAAGISVASGGVTISGLTVQDFATSIGIDVTSSGGATLAGDAVNANAQGIVVESGGNAAIIGCSIANNSPYQSDDSGGGIANHSFGTVSVTDCTITNNAAGIGGGIYNRGNLTVTDCTIDDNSAPNAEGGGIFSDFGTLTVSGCTIAGNSATFGMGGGIANWYFAGLTIINSTIANNSAIVGGGIENLGGLTAINDSIAYNHVSSNSGDFGTGVGGGLNNESDGSVILNNTIVAVNSFTTLDIVVTDDIAGMISSVSAHNLIGAGGAGGLTNGTNGNLIGVANLGLGGLADNGGPTQTIALLPGNPAIDAGSNALAVAAHSQPLMADQRGAPFARIAGTAVDIGAFEVQAIAPAPSVTNSTSVLPAYSNRVFIKGSGFESTTPGHNTVVFSNGATGTVSSASPNSLIVTFSAKPVAGILTAVVTTNGMSSRVPVQVATVVPVVTKITASLAITANTITIKGYGFDPTTPGNNTILLNNGAVGTVTAATATSLTVSLIKAPSAVGSLMAVVTSDGLSSGASVQVATVVPVVTKSTTILDLGPGTMTINGLGFDSANPGNNLVAFNGGAVGSVAAATATSITVTFSSLPKTAGSLTAVVTTDGTSSGTAVQVASIAPTVTFSNGHLAADATTLVITGSRFDPAALSNNRVAFNNSATGNVIAVSATSLTVKILAKPKTAGSLTAVVTINGVTSGAAVQVATVMPVVTKSAASLAITANTITIKGFGFDSTNPAKNTIIFSNGAQGIVTSATATSLTVTFTTKPDARGILTALLFTDGVPCDTAVQVATIE